MNRGADEATWLYPISHCGGPFRAAMCSSIRSRGIDETSKKINTIAFSTRPNDSGIKYSAMYSRPSGGVCVRVEAERLISFRFSLSSDRILRNDSRTPNTYYEQRRPSLSLPPPIAVCPLMCIKTIIMRFPNVCINY